ncbi:MAG: polysaccharide deacetylase family protein [Victivallales bacterium]|nr:polysaccharide deacetylase family protein [Victivallales bacterium]
MSKKLQVAMCWDDGVTTDIRLISIIRKYGAKATFNLNPGIVPDYTEAPRWLDTRGLNCWNQGFIPGHVGKADLKTIYGDFCVASHCWKHETLTRGVTLQEFVKAAVDAKHYLEDLFGRDCPGFAWPCGVHSQEAADALRESGFHYGRTCEYTDDLSSVKDPLRLPSNCHFLARDFYQLYSKAKEVGKFYFWGHSYETLNYEPLWQQLEYKIQYITEDPDAEWVDVIDLIKG